MKLIKELISGLEIIESRGDLETPISLISLDSRLVEPGTLFVAVSGNKVDGHNFIEEAINKGSKAVIYEKNPQNFCRDIVYLKVKDSHRALGLIASAFYDHPSQKLKLIGVTGTNGKTTIATLLHRLFRKLGYRVGLIGTIENKINDKKEKAIYTTPHPIILNKLLSDMVEAGCAYCFMEVSSHAVSERRIFGLYFNGGIFTNLTLDHLDYHKTFENYCEAKKLFFDSLPPDAFCLSNTDDSRGHYILSGSPAKKYFYGLKQPADFNERLETKLIGEFNAYNILAIYGIAVLLGQEKEKVKEIIKILEPAEGRFQYFRNPSGITAIIDYAHTPDALENVLKTIGEMQKGGRTITVVGCGGDRDRSKRPLMAKIGYELSDILILTSDNPRSESPKDIIAEMKQGLIGLSEEKTYTIIDRREAIVKARELALPGDYVLVAGKGHEKYQEIKGERIHFNDYEIIQKIF